MNLASRLAAGLALLNVNLDDAAQTQLLHYLALIEKWNRVHNLTAVRNISDMLSHHLFDSLAVLPHIDGAATLLDVGSGAGLPGIPLAIAKPGMKVSLLDSSQKRVAFLTQCKAELRLDNVTPVHGRVEDFRPAHGFDVVISRAFADLSEFVASGRQHIAAGGRLLAMKGRNVGDEIKKLPEAGVKYKLTQLTIPELNAERYLFEVSVS